MKVAIYTQKGTKSKESIELQEKIFGAKVNDDLMAQSVFIFLSNQRQGTKKTKHRGEVRGGGKKPWAQKTPDKARHGSRRSPIWVGGGHVHALRPKEWKLRLPLRMKRQAIFSAFAVKFNDDALKVVENFKISDEKLTNQVEELCKNFGKGTKVLVVVGDKNDNLYLGSKNLEEIDVTLATELNIYTILQHDVILLQRDAVEKIHQIWGLEKSEIKSQKPKTEKKTEIKVKSEKLKVGRLLESEASLDSTHPGQAKRDPRSRKAKSTKKTTVKKAVKTVKKKTVKKTTKRKTK